MSKGVCHFINVVIVKCIKALSEPLLIVKPPGGFPGDSECCEASSSEMLRTGTRNNVTKPYENHREPYEHHRAITGNPDENH